MTPQFWITVGYGLSGILPLFALLRRVRANARETQRLEEVVEERGHAEMTYDDFDERNGGDIRTLARKERSDLTWEVGLVGVGGVTLASITSIVAIWVL